jgi:hypothetical protein
VRMSSLPTIFTSRSPIILRRRLAPACLNFASPPKNLVKMILIAGST